MTIDAKIPLADERFGSRTWLSVERIALSDLGYIFFDLVKQGRWREEDIVDLMESLLTIFAYGFCARLAGVISEETGWPVASFWHPFEGEMRVAHAVCVDLTTGLAYDILGSRYLSEVRAELTEADGDLELRVIHPFEDDRPTAREYELIRTIAAGLVWMPPLKSSKVDADTWREAVMAYRTLLRTEGAVN